MTCLRHCQAACALRRLLLLRFLDFAGRDPSDVHSVTDHVRRAPLPVGSLRHVLFLQSHAPQDVESSVSQKKSLDSCFVKRRLAPRTITSVCDRQQTQSTPPDFKLRHYRAMRRPMNRANPGPGPATGFRRLPCRAASAFPRRALSGTRAQSRKGPPPWPKPAPPALPF